MPKQRILLTGDDGFDSLGTRILIHFLKDTYSLVIAGTKDQQSGVGGHKNVRKKGVWGEALVDGVRALWIDGSPVDAIEAAKQYFRGTFDYVLSGVNWGVNVGGCLISSGTFSAAFHSINLGLTNRAIALSWDIDPTLHFIRHTHMDGIETFIEHPGKDANTLLQTVLKNNCWGVSLLNINIPKKPAGRMEFATPLQDVHGFWPPLQLDKTTKQFSYKWGDHTLQMGEAGSEVQVLKRGNIAITPCQATMMDYRAYKRLHRKKP